ncbi:unnamed protein product [Ectocarpus sp. CCAP 1310/34]|nr:unnamed protein product [Ectocarpus sp. CCAP 1310/34]
MCKQAGQVLQRREAGGRLSSWPTLVLFACPLGQVIIDGVLLQKNSPEGVAREPRLRGPNPSFVFAYSKYIP